MLFSERSLILEDRFDGRISSFFETRFDVQSWDFLPDILLISTLMMRTSWRFFSGNSYFVPGE